MVFGILMKCSYSVETNKVLNVVELSDGELAYIRLAMARNISYARDQYQHEQ
jgi:hypothetical protein